MDTDGATRTVYRRFTGFSIFVSLSGGYHGNITTKNLPAAGLRAACQVFDHGMAGLVLLIKESDHYCPQKEHPFSLQEKGRRLFPRLYQAE
jgi:hypothetical protein